MPDRLELSTSGRTVTYILDPDHHALLEGERFEVVSGRPAARKSGGAVAPVYRLGTGGGVAVPTGRVLVRLAEGTRISDHADEIEKAGFKIAEPLSYAPHAAWVRPLQGGVAAALHGLDRLARTKGVEHVEPQMLMRVAHKSSR